jgi:AraC-like DNA-binding protein
MVVSELELKTVWPSKELADFVESFWMIRNHSAVGKEIVVLPDGRFDVIFYRPGNQILRATLRGLDTEPSHTVIPGQAVLFAVSFKLLAVEYLLDIKMAAVLNAGQSLPAGIWDITDDDLNDFQSFCAKVTVALLGFVKPNIDPRKQELFNLIHSSGGELSVQELASRVGWSSRQINRYFNQQFGLALKTYCTILRFRRSLPQIKDGRLFPEQNFADQTHFIKEVKKFSGVVPKELAKNQNDRFILLSGLPKE